MLAGYWDGAISRRVPERGLVAFWSGETGSWAGIWGMVVERGTEQVGKHHYSTAHETCLHQALTAAVYSISCRFWESLTGLYTKKG